MSFIPTAPRKTAQIITYFGMEQPVSLNAPLQLSSINFYISTSGLLNSRPFWLLRHLLFLRRIRDLTRLRQVVTFANCCAICRHMSGNPTRQSIKEKAAIGDCHQVIRFDHFGRIRDLTKLRQVVTFANCRAICSHMLGNPTRQSIKEKAAIGDFFFYGLPGRIRTCDLESRSLTRYPAVPRADE